MNESDKHWVAVHEAGHAVAHIRLFPKLYFDHISIIEDEPTGSLGHLTHFFDTTVVPENKPNDEAEWQFLRDAIVSCAGYAACLSANYGEAKSVSGCENDFERAGHRLESAKVQAVRLMSETTSIAAVRRLAEKLIEHERLDYEHVEMIIDMADGLVTEAEYSEWLERRKLFSQGG